MRKRILFLSANKFGYELLKEILKEGVVDVAAILTLSREATTIMYDGIPRVSWRRFGIPVDEIININNETKRIKEISPDFIIMCGWRQILDDSFFSEVHVPLIGFHPTLLPKGRGPAPIINSILDGVTLSGVTLYYVGKGLDDGDIVGQKSFTIAPDDHAGEVYKKMIAAGKYLIHKYLPLIVEGKAPRIPQNNSRATVFPRRSIQDNEIHLEYESLDDIHRKVRAFSKPYKGAYITKNNKKLIIWRAEIGECDD
jgi:methionyl-tRNA formyltransferase